MARARCQWMWASAETITKFSKAHFARNPLDAVSGMCMHSAISNQPIVQWYHIDENLDDSTNHDFTNQHPHYTYRKSIGVLAQKGDKSRNWKALQKAQGVACYHLLRWSEYQIEFSATSMTLVGMQHMNERLNIGERHFSLLLPCLLISCSVCHVARFEWECLSNRHG